jgi:hypothetical protein
MTYFVGLTLEGLVQLLKGQGADFTHLRTGWDQALGLALFAVVALDGHPLIGRRGEVLMKPQYSKRTSHSAGGAVDAFVRINKDSFVLLVQEDRTR